MATKPKSLKAPEKVKRPAHRPTSFREEYCEQAYKLCLLGATDKKLADFFEVSEVTLNAWKSVHPHFLKSLTQGKEVADAEIAHALFNRAKGYSHPEDDIRVMSVGGGVSEVVITPTVKHYPPDTPAATLWLKNRQPHVWREKVELEHSGPNGGAIKTDMNVTLTPSEAYLRMLG